jgi:hypothetical protein
MSGLRGGTLNKVNNLGFAVSREVVAVSWEVVAVSREVVAVSRKGVAARKYRLYAVQREEANWEAWRE